MLLSEAIEALAVATLADGRSERTAGDYRQKLHALLVFLGDRDAANVTADDLLGHSDVAVTWQHYAIFRTAELAAKHDKHSPIARMGREGKL